jgi:hypothetical protein
MADLRKPPLVSPTRLMNQRVSALLGWLRTQSQANSRAALRARALPALLMLCSRRDRRRAGGAGADHRRRAGGAVELPAGGLLRLTRPGFRRRRDSPYWRGSRWAEPRLVAGVAFTTWTADLLPRRPNFEGLREDKPTKDVKLERAHVGDRNRRVRLAWVEAVHA